MKILDHLWRPPLALLSLSRSKLQVGLSLRFKVFAPAQIYAMRALQMSTYGGSLSLIILPSA